MNKPTLAPLTIRNAVPGDTARLADLLGQLVDHQNVKVLPERIAALGADPATQVLVCEYEGKVCATLTISLCADIMFGTQPFAVLENVVVDAGLRSRGVGSHLLRHAEEWCMTQGCSKIMLMSAIGRADAHRFYLRAGYAGDSKRGFVKYRRDTGPA